MITRSEQDFIERERNRRKRRDAARAIIARSPRIAKTARKFVVKLIWPEHHPCYKRPHDCCSYCDHQDEVIAAMVQVARSHARQALRGHVFDGELEAALRAAEQERALAVRTPGQT